MLTEQTSPSAEESRPPPATSSLRRRHLDLNSDALGAAFRRVKVLCPRGHGGCHSHLTQGNLGLNPAGPTVAACGTVEPGLRPFCQRRGSPFHRSTHAPEASLRAPCPVHVDRRPPPVPPLEEYSSSRGVQSGAAAAQELD